MRDIETRVDSICQYYFAETPNDWSATRQAKAKVRSFIAVAHRDRPDISLPRVWEEAATLFPVDSSAFDDLATFLRDFPQLIAT
jgi:hypothetical protein